MTLLKKITIALTIIAVLVIAYYVKSDVLKVDILEHRHLLFLGEKGFSGLQ